jgi:hypothetical protein
VGSFVYEHACHCCQSHDHNDHACYDGVLHPGPLVCRRDLKEVGVRTRRSLPAACERCVVRTSFTS